MKKSIKTSLFIVALGVVVCLAGLVWLGLRPGEPLSSNPSDGFGGASFQVVVEKPRMDRFLGGILPTRLEERLLGGELRFSNASPGAKIGSVGSDRLELSAEGWDLLIEIDGQGKIAPGTRLIFPIEIAEKHWSLRCRPAEQAVGYLHVAAGPVSGMVDGSFVVELAKCEDAKTGKILDKEAGGNPGQAWPSSPLTLRGTFKGASPFRR
jgi:hypothetical protein